MKKSNSISDEVKNELKIYISDIQKNLADSGQEIEKSEIVKYVFYYLTNLTTNGDQVNFDQIVGTPEEVAQNFFLLNDIRYPSEPWYGGKMYELENTKISLPINSAIMQFLKYAQYVLTLLGIMLLLFFIIEINSYIVYNNTWIFLGIFHPSFLFLYPLYGLPLYWLLNRCRYSVWFRSGVSDINEWILKIRQTSIIHLINFSIQTIMAIIGSNTYFSDSYYDDYYYYDSETPLNFVRLENTIFYIALSSYLFYIAYNQIWSETNEIDVRPFKQRKQAIYISFIDKYFKYIKGIGFVVLVFIITQSIINVERYRKILTPNFSISNTYLIISSMILLSLYFKSRKPIYNEITTIWIQQVRKNISRSNIIYVLYPLFQVGFYAYILFNYGDALSNSYYLSTFPEIESLYRYSLQFAIYLFIALLYHIISKILLNKIESGIQNPSDLSNNISIKKD
ncbi:MAG: hypothetical protein OEY49_18490 [Candidatus Heimdallarchaeota archaeon]|nr:hypothetical protein [Candidatus Heimdallarchaeota archaeon]